MENLNSVSAENVKNVETVNSTKEIKKVESTKDKPKASEKPKVDKHPKNVLDLLNAYTVSAKAEKSLSGKKSIFKKEFNSKNARTTIRKKLFGNENSFGLFELYLKTLKEKKDLEAKKILEQIKSICKESYNAETNFSSYNEYATDNLDDSKLNPLKTFIAVYNGMKIKK